MIRLEKKEDWRETENLIRESFWNVYRPGCSEHYVMHVLRDDPAFIPELDFVMEQNGRLIGQNMFMKTVINADDGREIPVLTMGPIGIIPELRRQGFGKKLLDFCLEKALAMGFGAVLFEGNIKFYSHCGFDYARKFGIRYHDLPEGADDSFFLCQELIPGYLDGVTGEYATPSGYFVDEAAAEEFDKGFPPKEKLTLPKLIGFAAVMLGVFCISGISGAKMDPLGFISGILSAVTYAGMVIFNKKAKDIGGLENTMFQLGFAFMAVSVFLLIRQGFSIPVKGSDVLPILGLGLVHTGFGCWLYFSTMSKLPVQTVSILGYLEPLFAVLFSALLLSRPMLPLQWLGAGLIIGGAMIAECWHIFCKKTKT